MPIQNNKSISNGRLIVILAFIVIILGGGCWGYPAWRVYNARMTGEAEYQRAEKNRQIQVVQSQAKMEAAQFERGSDTVRALGISRSNQIIGASLSERYIQWLWVNNMENQDKSVIYVPSQQLGLPILEANRLTDVYQYNQQAGTGTEASPK